MAVRLLTFVLTLIAFNDAIVRLFAVIWLFATVRLMPPRGLERVTLPAVPFAVNEPVPLISPAPVLPTLMETLPLAAEMPFAAIRSPSSSYT